MPDQGGGLLARSGLDSIKIGGHKVPIALLAGGIALVGVIAILRARQQGQQVAVGAAPATAADSGFGMPLPSTDVGPAIANLSQQLTDLSQSISAPPASSGAPGAAANQITLTGAQTGLFSRPEFSADALVTWLPGGTVVQGTGGPPVKGGSFGQGNQQSSYWQPINYEGTTLYAWAPFTHI